VSVFSHFYDPFGDEIMCKCAVKKEKKSKVVTVKNSWRLRALFRHESIIKGL
jgi:hypothetical protein